MIRRSHFLSLGLHLLAFWALMNAPSIELPKRSPSEYEQIMAARKPEEKVVLYKFKKQLPAVRPQSARPATEPLRAEVESNQAIVSSARAPKRDQMTWTTTPELADVKPLDSANLLAVRLPDPAPKPFVAPPDIVRPPVAQIDVPLAPEIATAATLPPPDLKLRQLNKEFVAPDKPAPKVAKRVKTLDDVPVVTATNSLAPSIIPLAKAPPKSYSAPSQPLRTSTRQTARLDDAPATTPAIPLAATAGLASKLPPKTFAAPSALRAGTGRANTPAPDFEAPPDAEPLNVAVVGLKPIENAISLPSASSPASFSSGPKLNPKGADTEAGASGLSVPDLLIKGPQRATPAGPSAPSARAAELIAQARMTPTSRESLAAVVRQGEPVMTMRSFTRPTPTNSATRVTASPDPRLSGREVYMMAIQMPNLTSYSGSWLMWYAARTAAEAAGAPLAPPVAHRKVDPKYVATAVAERVQGSVRLACMIDVEGHVSHVELVQGLDDRLNKTAADALSRWEFYPATRNGDPVPVDVVVEIPFRLAPTAADKK